MAFALACSRTHLYAYPQQPIAEPAAAIIEALLQRRIAGEPIAYLIGQREFWSLPFTVGEGVLIPRPETEHLVECVLTHIKHHHQPVIADLGCGSGAIAIAIAKTRPDAILIASDNDWQCLQWARRNCSLNGTHNVLLIQSNWCDPLTGYGFDVIAANPPYVIDNDAALTSEGVRFESHTALVAGASGLLSLHEIIHKAPSCLAQQGALMLEHGASQGAAVRRLLQYSGFTMITTMLDLAGLERVSLGIWQTS